MMRSAILSACIAVAAVWVCHAQEAQTKDSAQAPAEKQAGGSSVAPAGAASGSSQKSGDTAKPAATPSSAVEADPAKLAAPKPGEEAKIAGAAPVDAGSYVIGAEDVLGIHIWNDTQLSGSYQVRPDGKISMPLIHEIVAAGLTPTELEKSLAQSLSSLYNAPEITVSVTAVNSKKYYIQGEVQKPGAYPLVVPTTMLEALVNAGGFRDFANTKNIIILRGAKRMSFNYKEVTNGKKLEQNIFLQSGDQIIVH